MCTSGGGTAAGGALLMITDGVSAALARASASSCLKHQINYQIIILSVTILLKEKLTPFYAAREPCT